MYFAVVHRCGVVCGPQYRTAAGGGLTAAQQLTGSDGDKGGGVLKDAVIEPQLGLMELFLKPSAMRGPGKTSGHIIYLQSANGAYFCCQSPS